jgi:hypothetical protein
MNYSNKKFVFCCCCWSSAVLSVVEVSPTANGIQKTKCNKYSTIWILLVVGENSNNNIKSFCFCNLFYTRSASVNRRRGVTKFQFAKKEAKAWELTHKAQL